MKNLIFITLVSSFATLISCKPSVVNTKCIDKEGINNDIICTMEYNPVCGCDNKTYGNECEAKKSGVQKWTMGACPD